MTKLPQTHPAMRLARSIVDVVLGETDLDVPTRQALNDRCDQAVAARLLAEGLGHEPSSVEWEYDVRSLHVDDLGFERDVDVVTTLDRSGELGWQAIAILPTQPLRVLCKRPKRSASHAGD